MKQSIFIGLYRLLYLLLGKTTMRIEMLNITQGDVIARAGEKDLGVNIHSSVDGHVKEVAEDWVEVHT